MFTLIIKLIIILIRISKTSTKEEIINRQFTWNLLQGMFLVSLTVTHLYLCHHGENMSFFIFFRLIVPVKSWSFYFQIIILSFQTTTLKFHIISQVLITILTSLNIKISQSLRLTMNIFVKLSIWCPQKNSQLIKSFKNCFY